MQLGVNITALRSGGIIKRSTELADAHLPLPVNGSLVYLSLSDIYQSLEIQRL